MNSRHQRHHVVFMNLAATGHMNPTLPLVAELKARSCEVTYFVEERMRSVVEAAGAVWQPFRNPYNHETGTPSMLPESGIAKYVPAGTPKDQYADLPSSLVYTAELLLPSLLEDLRACKPTLIVHDPFLAFGQVAGHVLGVPAVTMLTMPGPGLMFKPDDVVDSWESKPWVDGPRREILHQYGFDVFKNGMQLESYSPTLNLVTTIDELYVPPRQGRQEERFGTFPFSCIGVLIDPKVKRIGNANVDPADAQHFDLDELDAAQTSGRQIIYISLGTVASSEAFWTKPFGHFGKGNGLEDCTGKALTQHVFRACFEAFGDGSDSAALVVLSVGPQEDVLDGLPAAPPNFRLYKMVPQLEALRRSSVFVTHGGANSMHEALSLGVPMAVVPLFGDQPQNADSLEALGAAISFHQPLTSVSPKALVLALEKLLQPDHTENSFRAAAKSAAQKFQGAKSVTTATDALLKVSVGMKAEIGGA